MVNDPLELLFLDDPPARPVVLVELPGRDAGRLAAALAGMPHGGTRRVLPAPPPEVAASEAQAWHRDAWHALTGDERRSLALASGPSARHLAAVLGDACEAVALVAEPLTALRGVSTRRLPKERALTALAAGDEHHERRLRPWSNPQSRALLAPWHDAGELAVTLGPPDDAEHWRALLFGDVLGRVDVTGDAEALVRRVAERLGVKPKRAARAARSLAAAGDAGKAVRPPQAELLLALSWLDAELSAWCSAAPAAAGA